MKYKDILKKLPFIKEKLKSLKPSLSDILLEMFNSKEKLLIIDVGSNIGKSISFFRYIFPNSRIYSFEYTPYVFSELERKFNNFVDVYLFNIAFGEENTVKKFNISEYSS